MSEDPEKPARTGPRFLLMVLAFVVPIVGILAATIIWWTRQGAAGEGGLPAGLLLLPGLAVIGVGYWLADRYWIRGK